MDRFSFLGIFVWGSVVQIFFAGSLLGLGIEFALIFAVDHRFPLVGDVRLRFTLPFLPLAPMTECVWSLSGPQPFTSLPVTPCFIRFYFSQK